ncbi:uncharacterized protein LOC131997884 [Stomoxys calcitrans]|uniref:uncharacterized protein LOC131997884 n=1 Tax=Stomoxys calcitrans TaxID=35570 RepID=UPI0027E23906|nr:uncharacterized protein LOC131997884 [Stomoxys calcitrans]
MVLNVIIALILLSSASGTQESNKVTSSMITKMDITFAVELVASMHSLHEFQNFVFFITQRLIWNGNHLAGDLLQEFGKELSMVPAVMLINNTKEMKGFLSTPTLSLVLTTNHDDPIMEVAALSMHGMRLFKTLFIYYPQSSETQESLRTNIDLLYQWIWKHQFINTVLITVEQNIFIQQPYPKPQVINITEDWSMQSFFINYRRNFQGYIIKTPIRKDFPRVFYMSKEQPGIKIKSRVSGASGKLFMAFVKHINATISQPGYIGHENEPANVPELLDRVASGQLEISMHSYNDMLNTSSGKSYPIGINDWCIMVPFRKHSPEHEYLQKSFQTYTWLLICFSVVYIAMGIWICSPEQKRDMGVCFLQALSSTLLIMPLKILQTATMRMRCLYVLLFISGFLVTNLYSSKMSSFLTAAPEVTQIDTVQDVINEKLPIMVETYEYNVLLLNNYPKEFMDLVIPVSKSKMDQHRDFFNTSYGYSTQSDRWNFANFQQRFLKNPTFHLSKICIGPFYHVFPLLGDSHLAKPLETFIKDALEMGLTRHWQRQAFLDALFLGYVHMIPNQSSFEPLPLNFFRSLWILLGFGTAMGCLTFVLELRGIDWPKIQKGCGKCCQRLCDKIYEM